MSGAHSVILYMLNKTICESSWQFKLICMSYVHNTNKFKLNPIHVLSSARHVQPDTIYITSFSDNIMIVFNIYPLASKKGSSSVCSLLRESLCERRWEMEVDEWKICSAPDELR